MTKPFLKWAGGKWAIAEQLAKLMPPDLASRCYREPFLGGGGLFFWLSSHGLLGRVALSDVLEPLANAYRVVRDEPDELVWRLEGLKDTHSEEQFYRVRAEFNARTGGLVERAADLIYLNKTCFNGLYRTNRKGDFDTPFGKYLNPGIVDAERIHDASIALQGCAIGCADFAESFRSAIPGDVIYLDPPYVPVSKTANFAGYAGAFGPADQERLARTFRELDEKGCLLVLSNSDTPEVRRLYDGFDITTIEAPRRISSRASTRVPIGEVVVRNAASWGKRSSAEVAAE